MEKALFEIQGDVKKDPALYRDRVNTFIDEFNQHFSLFPETPSGPNTRLAELVTFLSQICPYFLTELKHFPSQLLNILNNYYSALDSEFRKIVFAALCLLRNREQIPAMSLLPICFKLFRCQDKALRVQAFNFLIKDIKKINKHTQNYQINKQLQGFIYDMIGDSNITAAKKSLHVLMTLYKKRVWIDSRTINVIANACLSKEAKLVKIGCTFMLLADDNELYSDSDSEAEEEPSKVIVGAKKTKGKLHQKERGVKHFNKQQRRKERKMESKEPSFLTIDQLNDAQGFVEKMLTSLKKVFNKGKHELQIIMLQVTARIVGRHKLMLTELYSFLQRFITPKSKKVTQMLIICAEASHELVPPSEINPVIKKILDNFLSEHCSEEFIVLGLNCMKEICKRQPLVMTKELLEHINTFKFFKNRSVVMACSGLINLFKEIRPSLLRNKLRPGEEDLVGEYGEVRVYSRVPGAELLEMSEAERGLNNQQVIIQQPQQKSENLIRLETLIEKRREEAAKSNEGGGILKKRAKLEEENDDEGSSEEEEESGEFESDEEQSNNCEPDSQDEELESDDSGKESENVGSEDISFDDDEEEIDLKGDSSQEESEVEAEIENNKITQLAEGDEHEGYKSAIEGVPYECDRILTQNDFKRIRQLKREAEAKRRRMDVDLFGSSDEESNEFVGADDLETMQISKLQKIRQTVEEKKMHKRHKKDKKGGKTNKQHAKSKPMMMVLDKKKNSLKQKFEAVKKKIRRSKQQLGKFSKRFNSTKRQA